MALKNKPFNVLRIPALNGEWVHAHMSETGNICINTSGYTEFKPEVLLKALESIVKTRALAIDFSP